MSPRSDFDELVGGDLTPAERERLRGVHDLLVQAGPPPELAPHMEAGPTLAVYFPAYGQLGATTLQLVLHTRGQPEAAIRLEVLWNQLAHIETFSLLCGYAFGHFYKEAGADDICRQHSHVIGAGGEALATPKPE